MVRNVSIFDSSRSDVAIAVIVAVALIVEGNIRADGGLTLVGYPLAGLAAATLAWRRAAPLGAIIAVEIGAFVCAVAISTTWVATAIVLIALYTVSRHGRRRRSLVVVAVTAVAVLFTIFLIDGSFDWGSVAIRILLLFVAAALGDTRRVRKALAVAAVERAARAEHDREEESRRRLEAARLSIARDVHDTLAHALVEINIRAGVTVHVKGEDPEEALASIQQSSARALNDLRATLNMLRDNDETALTSPALDLDAVPDLIRRACEAGLDAEAEIQIDGTSVPSAVGQVGFRVVQEALTNVLRHARATSTRVRIQIEGDGLDIAVSDDGHGRPASGNGHGLSGMNERITALGGQLDAGPSQAGGWRIHARLPLSARAPA